MHALEVPRDYFEGLDLDPVQQVRVVARTFLDSELLIFSDEL